MHNHDHGHQDAGQRLLISLVLVLLFAGIEAVAGWWSGSLALLGDAGHMFSDAAALGVAALAARVARRPPSRQHSYGLGRLEVIAAVSNGILMIVVVVGIFMEALERLRAPAPVHGVVVMLVALVGLAINVFVALLLSRGERSLNVRGALLHVMGDMLGSVAALVAGLVIFLGGSVLVDPLLSVFICVLILVSSVRLLREAVHVLMEGVPPHLDLPEVGSAIARMDAQIHSVHDLHIWSLSSGLVALSAHVVVDDLDRWSELLNKTQAMLRDEFGIEHVTLQPESITQPLQHIVEPGARG